MCRGVYMCACVCVSVRMCTCLCRCVCVYVSVCMSGCLHVCMCVCMSICECICMCVCVCTPTPTPPVLCAGPSECCYGKSSLLDTCHTLAKATRKSWSSSPVEDGWTHLRTARGLCMTLRIFYNLLSTIFLFKKYLQPHMLFDFQDEGTDGWPHLICPKIGVCL